MSETQLLYFNTINVNDLEDYYDANTVLNGNDIRIDLNFENTSIDQQKIDEINTFLAQIAVFDLNNKNYIQQDYQDDDGETVRLYIDHHLEILEAEELSSLIDTTKDTEDQKAELIEKLRLIRVGLYPENDSYFATFDYSLGSDLTDYLVVVNTNKDGNLVYMSMES